jgi:hypothetical protein
MAITRSVMTTFLAPSAHHVSIFSQEDTMPVSWLIYSDDFDANNCGLADAIRRHGHAVCEIDRPTPPYHWDDTSNAYRQAFPRGACVVTLADIDLVQRIRADDIWTPGVFATIEHFYCSQYYAHFGRFLLNRDYAMLPFAELARCADFLFRTFGRDGRIFVRPDSPLKLFTGLVVARDSLAKDLEFMAFYEFPTESLVVVSSPKTIVKEWRFVVADGHVVTGSQYKEGDKVVALPHYDHAAFDLAAAIAGSYWPDPVWVLDICQTNDGAFHLLECGPFSFAGLYACDQDAVVEAVSSAAERTHAARQPRGSG